MFGLWLAPAGGAHARPRSTRHRAVLAAGPVVLVVAASMEFAAGLLDPFWRRLAKLMR